MATTFENILNRAKKQGVTEQRTKESISWYRNSIRKTAISPTRIIREEKNNLVNSWTNVGIGKLYFVNYDPKHKKTLAYYDNFPLVIPIERYKDGFLGLNLHYLPPVLRAKLLDELYNTLNNQKFDEKTKMQVSYSILKSAATSPWFKPCIKRYLGNHFRSRFVKVPAENWTAAVFLPAESFEKATRKTVWADSRRIVRER